MSIELIEVAPCGIARTMSQDSEYDDALEVPDSLELDENGEMIQVKKETEWIDNKGVKVFCIMCHAFFFILTYCSVYSIIFLVTNLFTHS